MACAQQIGKPQCIQWVGRGIAWHDIGCFAPTERVKVVVVAVTVCGEGSIGAIQVPHSSALPGMMNPPDDVMLISR